MPRQDEIGRTWTVLYSCAHLMEIFPVATHDAIIKKAITVAFVKVCRVGTLPSLVYIFVQVYGHVMVIVKGDECGRIASEQVLLHLLRVWLRIRCPYRFAHEPRILTIL